MQAKRRAQTREPGVKTPEVSEAAESQPGKESRSPSDERRKTPRRAQRSERSSRAPAPSRPKRASKSASKDSKRPVKRASKKEAPVFNVGDQCRLNRGIFAGKQGEVTGKGKPGYYAVKVGILEVNVSAFDLEVLSD